MVEERTLRLLPYLPDGVSELYVHPATKATPALATAMPSGLSCGRGIRGADECGAQGTHRRTRDRVDPYAALARGDSGA